MLEETKNEWRELEKQVNKNDAQLLGLIIEGRSRNVKMVTAEPVDQPSLPGRLLEPNPAHHPQREELRHG